MENRIRLLPEIVANQIAAGEVVDNPASAIKEMMENSIDAGASSVTVNFRNAGLELIQIVDDGCGMSPMDARMAFDRHATSKIETFDDLKGSFSGWLTAITRNAALNRARGGTVADSTEEIPQNTPSTLPTPEEAVLMAERKAALGRAIDGLASRDKAIFYRKYYYLQPTAQIAAELGMTERAVEGRLYRIRKRLRNKLGGEGYEC